MTKEEDDMRPGSVSVIVCAYNNWPDVEMTIASALHQSLPPLEVIVVDNSSTDQTQQEVPWRFGQSVRYIHQPNKECAGGYNTGFAASRGEFIQFLDGDDVLAPNKIEKQVEILRSDPKLDIVYGAVRTFQTAGGAASWTDLAAPPVDDMLASLTAPHGIWLNTLGVLCHRRVFDKVGPWDEKLYVEDADYWLRAAWAGCRFGHCAGSPMGFVRRRPGQKMEDVSAMERGLEEVWNKALGYITREPYRGLLIEKIADWRFRKAISRDRRATREALVDLALARTTSPGTISAIAYAVAWATIVLPGGNALARCRWLQPMRSFLARRLRHGESNISGV